MISVQRLVDVVSVKKIYSFRCIFFCSFYTNFADSHYQDQHEMCTREAFTVKTRNLLQCTIDFFHENISLLSAPSESPQYRTISQIPFGSVEIKEKFTDKILNPVVKSSVSFFLLIMNKLAYFMLVFHCNRIHCPVPFISKMDSLTQD